MKKLLPILCLLVSSIAAAATATLSERDFTQAFLERAKTSAKGYELKIVRPLQLTAKDPGGETVTVFLDNAYNQYKTDPERLETILDTQLNTLRAREQVMATSGQEAILAVIKPLDYLDNVKRQLAKAGAGKDEVPLVYERLNEELYVFYVFDSETGMRTVTKGDLTKLKLDVSALRPMAIRQLETYFTRNNVTIQRIERAGAAKIYGVYVDENYEASILLLDKYWNKKTFDVAGDIVAFVPARNLVLVTGSDDAEGMRLATEVARRGFGELAYSISPRGYRYVNGAWVPVSN